MGNKMAVVESGSQSFEDAVESLKEILRVTKDELDQFNISSMYVDKEKILLSAAEKLFPVLDAYFDEFWEYFLSFKDHVLDEKRCFFNQMLYPYLGKSIETNTYIRSRPLGYAGDFVMMNYIYDYHDKRYLGDSLYSMLINRYTCNINVAKSNIARKDYIKNSILQTLTANKNAAILSVGCGSAREIIELLQEGKIEKGTFHLLDLEKKAVAYVQRQLSNLVYDKTKIDIHFYVMDLVEVIKNDQFFSLFANVELLYASGVFDYLSVRVARKTFARLFSITKKDLIVFNMSLENARHRAYYEVFGDWRMYHRTKEELLEWGVDLTGNKIFKVENPVGCNSYWILKASKI